VYYNLDRINVVSSNNVFRSLARTSSGTPGGSLTINTIAG